MDSNEVRYALVKYKFSSDIQSKIKGLCAYDNYNGIVALLADYFVIAGAIYLSELSMYWYPLTLLLIGSRQRALATILHEAAHKTLVRNKKLNRLLGTCFSGYLIFQTWNAYTCSHIFNHHVKLGNRECDPDFKHYIATGIFAETSKHRFIGKYLVRPMLCLNIGETLRYLIVNRLLGTGSRQEFLPLALSVFCFSAIGSAIVGWKFFLIYWLLPYLTTFQIITWFIELAEHYPLVCHARCDLYATRNRFSHPVEAVFTAMHGENFHLVHHLFPGVPFWNMKKAHELLLNDSEYARVNASFGGIFLSGNDVRSKWNKLITQFDRTVYDKG